MIPDMKIVLRIFILLAAISFPATAALSAYIPSDSGYRHEVDALVEGAIDHGLISGGVVLIGNNHENIFCGAYGRLSGSAESGPVEPDSLFDIASLTKVVATTPAVMKLVEEGKVSLDDPVSRWFPEFVGRQKDDLRVVHLLTHTSGLSDVSLPLGNSIQFLVERAASMTLRATPGTRFHYADINFILLGELVRRASGLSLDCFAAANIFYPLHMFDTSFNPAPRNLSRCAATLDYDNSYLFGSVQDHTAFFLGGVAGHAGLFTTAQDLSLFCRMVLNGGSFDGHCVLMRKTMQRTIVPYSCQGGKVLRGLGWDISSPYSSPRGTAFSDASFGHTGYSGCSVWIDPEENVFVVFLSARLDYKRKQDFNTLRSNLSTVAAHLAADGLPIHDFTRKFE
jgi:CubicO group peptidase (beta-lactamase class C family)